MVITVIFSIVLFLFSFMTVINYSYSMENEFIAGINSSLVEEIRTSIANGKSMDKYYGLEALLNKSVKIIGDDCVIFAYDKKDQLCGCSNPAVYPFDTKGYKEVCIDIESSVGDKEGSLSVYYPKKRIIDTIIPSAIQGAVGSAIILAIIVFVFSLLLIKMVCSQRRAMLVIVGGIIIQGLLCTYLYAGIFRDSAEKNIYGIAEYLGNSMIAMEEKGIQLNDISDIDEYLEKEVEKYEWVKKIYLSKDITTSSGEAYVLKLSDGDNLNVVFDISKKYITKRVLQMLLAFFATVILAIIVMVETLPLSDLIIFRRTAKYDSRNPMQYEFAASSLRLTNFLMSTFSYICLSFAALQIKEWNRGIGGISPQIASVIVFVVDLFRRRKARKYGRRRPAVCAERK